MEHEIFFVSFFLVLGNFYHDSLKAEEHVGMRVMQIMSTLSKRE